MLDSTTLQITAPSHLAALLQREIARCITRIAECESREAALGGTALNPPDPKLRAAIDRDRDRAFISLSRAMKMLRDLQKAHPQQAQPSAAESAPQAEVRTEHPQVARGARCPCGSGLKYKRCHGWAAPATQSPKKPPTHSHKSTSTPNGFEFSFAPSAPTVGNLPASQPCHSARRTPSRGTLKPESLVGESYGNS